jgi:hypothetical protein
VGLSFVFQQNNDPTHLKLCKGYFTKKESDGVLHQMSWPPQSPYNPIEMVWDELDRRLKEKQPTSAQHLWELLQDCQKSIPGGNLMKLVERMPRECKAIIKAKGGYFNKKMIFQILQTLFGLLQNKENTLNK